MAVHGVHARVLTEAGEPIPGLSAAGNTAASGRGHTSPGPGSTIGPAAVFGYLGARHAAIADPTSSPARTTDKETSA